MLIPWLEKLADAGHISNAAKSYIYNDCVQILEQAPNILKIATEKPVDTPFGPATPLPKNPAAPKTQAPKDKSSGGGINLPPAVGSAMAAAMPAMKMYATYKPFLMLAGQAYSEAKKFYEPFGVSKEIYKNRVRLENDPSFKTEKDLAKAHSRFNEIAVFAPYVAQDYDLSKRLIEGRLHSGLTEADILTLSGLQHGRTPATVKKELKLRQIVGKQYIKQNEKSLQQSMKKQAEAFGVICGIIKEAAPKTSAPSLGRLAKQVGLLMGIPAAGGLALGAYKHVLHNKAQKQLKENIEDSFHKVMKDKSTPGETFRANPAAAREAFDVLAHFSPNIAVQPTAAKSFMAALIDARGYGATPEIVKTLTDVQRNIKSSSHNPFEEGFGAGAKHLGIGSAFSGLTKEVGQGFAADVSAYAL